VQVRNILTCWKLLSLPFSWTIGFVFIKDSTQENY
jgi:hypothetical protein